ncbi:MAG: hypothetical protein CVV41_15915 [Candidatus Riflebacteria bacterium HGW-Riflebacteria-1]|jgi:hypothetical protein|nr:MAG: hypothetical protein CVV41_15915 [Candidatus Riflebacteria bacterium HGW-Riflebacteria-1]
MKNQKSDKSFACRATRHRGTTLCGQRLAGGCLLLKLLCLLTLCMPAYAQSADPDNLQRNLETAFMRAFSDPIEFRNSEIFQLLGYKPDEIAEIGKITPCPAAIKVVAESNGQPDGFKNISVICTKVIYYNMTIDQVTFDFPDCRLSLDDLNQGRLRFLGSDLIRLKTEVSSEDIAKVFDLVARARKLSSLRIKLDKDLATVHGRVTRGLLVVDFKIRGSTELVDPKTVFFRCDRMEMNGFRLPRNEVNGVFRQINPVFDAKKTWLNLNIASISIRRGLVETIATIERRKG